MAEENQEQTVPAENERQTVPSKKKILLLLVPIFVVVGVVIGLYFTGMADSFLSSTRSEDGDTESSSDEKQDLPAAIFFDVPELLVNLSVKAGQKPIYFKIKVALEVNTVEDSAYAEKMLPRIVDSLQFYLREMRLEEIQGSIGTYRLKEEIQNRLNRILAPVKIKDVLFKDILIQ